MIVLGRAVGLVSDILEQAERKGVFAQLERLGLVQQVKIFLLLGQGKQEGMRNLLLLEGGPGSIELAFASINQQDIGKQLTFVVQFPVAA